jgi:hypothetical protein
MGTISHAAESFGGQLEALVADRFVQAAEDELTRRWAARGGSPTPAYAESLRELAVLATTRLQGVCTRLLAWRVSAQGRARDLAEAAGAVAHGADGCHEIAPRLVDALLAEGLDAAIPAYAGANLDSEYADSIENILIELAKVTPVASSAVGHGEALRVDGTSSDRSECTFQVAASVLASLSTFRLLVIVGKVQAATKLVPSADKPAAVRLMNLIGKLRLGLVSSTHMAQSAQTMRILSELSKDKALKCYSQEIKHAALDAAAHLLVNADAQRDPSVDYSPWDKVVQDVWEEAAALRTKPKHALPALRLLAAIVSVVPNTSVDCKAASALRDHVLVLLASVKPAGGAVSKFLSATGIAAAKPCEATRLSGLQALHSIMRRLVKRNTGCGLLLVICKHGVWPVTCDL